ncbi:Do family serine endopeptidase [Telluribacter humicola]|uniref:Do family serine endopeptidase n=1 Tax=Telluribacter humicola TaxID=1720261 RepID=UPI001A9778C5|nr:Do family serine endopeptidase [Telluribacter humicola]
MKTNWKAIALVGVLSSATTIAGFKLLDSDGERDVIFKESPAETLSRFTSTGLPAGTPGDFTYAAEVATPTVVHIKSSMVRQAARGGQPQVPDFFREFFGDEMRAQPRGPQRAEASGSGVIISADGYIVTNNHVVEGSDQLEVSLYNKSKIPAKVIGTDPSTDIAVIKVDRKDLPAVIFGNSDAVKVGEWVVAVGNPFNLESTVTAGIVSAKGRGLGIISQEYARKYGNSGDFEGDSPLESFIQTDAVVNPGNSGGALVNLRGELVGINTAIASPTGSFAGYAFAVPASIVKKVSSDIIKYGAVQRGYLGIALDDLDSRKAEEYGVKISEGVYVRDFTDNSAAKAAGIAKGDVIVRVDDIPVGTIPQLQQAIGLHRPGDKVTVTVNRNGQVKDLNVTLRNRTGGSDVIRREESTSAVSTLGALFGNLNDQEVQRLSRYNVAGGVKITAIEGGKLARAGVEEGFIITKVNGKAVRSVKELEQALSGKTDTMVQFEGFYIDAPRDVFTFGFRL